MFAFTCPQCRADVSMPARRLLVRVDADTSAGGELLFTCLACHQTSTLPLDVNAAAAVVMAGVTHLSLSEPVVEHPESRPEGPAFTHDDLLDWHAALDRDASGECFDALVGGEC